MIATISKQDIEFLQERGIDPQLLDQYRQALINGFPHMQLSTNCTIGKEIQQFEVAELDRLRSVYKQSKGLKVVKFVPASGAASRMFKDLFSFLESGKTSDLVEGFFARMHLYPFYEELNKRWSDTPRASTEDQRKTMLKLLLLQEGMNYGALPKGLIKFHSYPDGHSRTAFEEHFHEAFLYALSDGEAHLHFTIPDNSRLEVEGHLEGVKNCLEAHFKVKYHIETSVQKPSTDTPALYTSDLSWVRDESGMLLLRPAGHGALLENLNDLDADIVFVKNIDNVVPDAHKKTTVAYKELLAGVLLEVQDSIFKFISQLESAKLDRDGCAVFMKKWFNIDIRHITDSELTSMLNRPLRVCGMVKNEGEPGGGPFLVRESDGTESLQIVEKSQVDLNEPTQMEILENASHFNPVDLVIGMKDFKGRPFNLLNYRNPHTGMVVSKNYYGREIKALELPGLWNGSMHFWNTIFVEVPGDTFNPVKTVFDLLRPAHLTN